MASDVLRSQILALPLYKNLRDHYFGRSVPDYWDKQDKQDERDDEDDEEDEWEDEWEDEVVYVNGHAKSFSKVTNEDLQDMTTAEYENYQRI